MTKVAGKAHLTLTESVVKPNAIIHVDIHNFQLASGFDIRPQQDAFLIAERYS